MQRNYKIVGLDCANCAAKVENAINKISGVNSASVNFITQKLLIDIDDEKFDEIMNDVIKHCKKVEPDFNIAF